MCFPTTKYDLEWSIKNLHNSLGKTLDISAILIEKIHNGHESYKFKLNNKNFLFCSSKITADRPGHFAVLWKKDINLKNIPYNAEDNIDIIIINCRYNDRYTKELYHGQYYFSKDILIAENIFATSSQKGKMAIRVFPPWSQLMSENNKRFYEENNLNVKPTNEFSASARKSQEWQLNNFVNLTEKDDLDKIKGKILLT